LLPAAGYDLVYGGASIGLMGTIADSVLAAGGEVIGVIPASIAEKEIAHEGLSALHVTGSMHERKLKMADLSDAFVALPGGLGTLEELFEIWTWAQLGFHEKPIALYNVLDYYDGLIDFLDASTSAGFIKPGHREMLIVDDNPAAMLARITTYRHERVDKLG
jgi:uncharacterized protein (TIGR00730 family)